MIASRESSHIKSRMEGNKVFDAWLILAALLLLLMGLLSLYSQGRANGEVFFRKQLFNIAVGLLPAAFFALINPKVLAKLSPFLYWVSVIGLVIVLKMGQSRNGAERWINLGMVQFQPSEMAKLFLIITISTYFVKHWEEIKSLKTFLISLVHVGVPMILIAKQPHWGATLVVFVLWLCICVAANVPWKYLAVLAAIAGVILFGSLMFPRVFPKVFRGYHANRLDAFLGQTTKKGSNYQTERAMIAFGKGGVMGDGFGKGTQGPFIPEQESDFIFTVPGEELGLVGCTIILAFYGFLFYRIWLVMLWATDPFFRMMAAGVLGLFMIHTFVNLFMVLKLLPVIGLWLPFMSYGGTAMWLCMSAVALILNIERQSLRL